MQGVFPAVLYAILFSQNGRCYAELSSSSSPGTKTATAKQMRKTPHCNTDAEVPSALLGVKAAYLKCYADQLEYFSCAEGIMEIKDRRVMQLTKVLKPYIRKHLVQTIVCEVYTYGKNPNSYDGH
jgi:hypothetical protein